MTPAPLIFYRQRPDQIGLYDRFDRQLTYLRISVTDRCNMRCDYCRPAADAYKAEPHGQILRYEEIEHITRLAAELGVSKVRITGGEPLVRRDLLKLIEKLAAIPGITDLSITTNATLLAKYADDLAMAGLNRINISLDSLNALRFRKLTGAELAPVLKGIEAAKKAGLTPIKLNTVLMRGINAGENYSEVAELIDFAICCDATIRFIELMPMKQGLDWDKHYISIDEVLAEDDVRQRIDLEAVAESQNTAASYLPLKNSPQKVGFITPMSERFCDDCNRLRLTADGHLRSCLPAESELNLRDLIRSGGSDDDVRNLFRRSAMIKPKIGTYGFNKDSEQRSMIHIGG
ncbi:cyclic pyranopterin phosphate synthase [Mariprofundus micogutta]|uniref:GTP 3',8-cyclase n=1 Tax=Mariprofundus micogutta TaxID=1921010 RepID=A0A1L8CQH1_9PROT|nr:GTP 3',8-cyclase MoaA [Mariprofundus micogutta]GAV21133.1 cyclic pyranopterin phosphate synthase [Mariprofundus micogutta]